MEIPHLTNIDRSEHYKKVRSALVQDQTLQQGKATRVSLGKAGGYAGKVDVTISGGPGFASSWTADVWTRFPARIRAAATVLRDFGHRGRFRIAHKDGELTIAPLDWMRQPTASDIRLKIAVHEIIKSGITAEPNGATQPERIFAGQTVFLRDPEVRAWVLLNADGICEGCDSAAPFETDYGLPFLEVHHVKMLADGGSDRITNAVAVCPNCHRRLHYSRDRADFRDSLYRKIPRLRHE